MNPCSIHHVVYGNQERTEEDSKKGSKNEKRVVEDSVGKGYQQCLRAVMGQAGGTYLFFISETFELLL